MIQSKICMSELRENEVQVMVIIQLKIWYTLKLNFFDKSKMYALEIKV